jgi:uncharacterized membrane protein
VAEIDAIFAQFALAIALLIEAIMVVLVVIGSLDAIYKTFNVIATRQPFLLAARDIWLRYAAWIVLGLEFALAADLIRTIVAPSWDEIGKLTTIAAIRTGLAYFLGRDINEARQTVGSAERR